MATRKPHFQTMRFIIYDIRSDAYGLSTSPLNADGPLKFAEDSKFRRGIIRADGVMRS